MARELGGERERRGERERESVCVNEWRWKRQRVGPVMGSSSCLFWLHLHLHLGILASTFPPFPGSYFGPLTARATLVKV